MWRNVLSCQRQQPATDSYSPDLSYKLSLLTNSGIGSPGLALNKSRHA